MRRSMLATIVCMMLVLCARAQDRMITGKVLNEKGDPVQNASVLIKNASSGVKTDFEGSFSIKVPSTAKFLTISSIGYANYELPIGAANNYTVHLIASMQDMESVVVTGYGSTRKKAFTGSAAVVTNDKFKDLQVSTITGVLQGNASGVLAVTSTGQPGENPTIRIRGIGSFNASNDPLILLDGVPFGGNLNSINPADIESVTVLKDASATGIYGSRGANGILQIVTKRGKGRTKFEFSGITGFSRRAVPEYSRVNAKEYYELTWEALKNDAIADPTLLTQFGVPTAEEYASKVVVSRIVYNPFGVAEPVGNDGKLVRGAKMLWNDNWVDEVSRTGVRKDFNFNVSGADLSNTIRYFLSGGYLQDQGTIIESEFKRYTGRAKLDITPVKWFRVGLNSSLMYSNQNYPYQGNGGASNVLAYARSIGPVYPVHLRNYNTGEYILDGAGNKIFDFGNNSATLGELRPDVEFRPFNIGQNPIGTTSLNPITNEVLTASGIVYAELDLMKGLLFRTQYSVDYNQYDANLFWNPFYGDGTTSGGYSFRGIDLTYSQNFVNTLTYDRYFGKIHHINIVGGMEAYRRKMERSSINKTGFTFARPTQPSYGSVADAGGSIEANRLVSYFARLGYDLADKYHLSLSVRGDASTRFADTSRWGGFYAAGVSWNLDREPFMANVKWLSDLKLKLSYGTTGNQELPGSFPYLSTYNAGSNIGSASGSVIATVGNGFLTWETQKQLDAGIEFGIFSNRITGSFVFFDRRSDKLLFSRPLPGSTGIGSVNDNVGGVKNFGYEVELSSVNIRQKDFEWTTSFNLTRLRNEITDPAPGTTQEKGRSWYDWFLREWAGVDAADGMPMWYRDDPADPSKKITTKDYNSATRYFLGNRLPKFTGGITNTLRYKNLDLSVLASFAIGGLMYDGDYAGLMGNFNNAGSGFSSDILNRWQSAENPGNGEVPKLTTGVNNANGASDRFLTDITYMRVRNITLGYRVPPAILKRAYLTSARVFVDLQNAFTFYGGKKGTDPEAGLNAQTSNHNTTAYRTIAIGINLGL